MRTRTKGILLADGGERIVNKQHRGERIFQRLGAVSQEEAEAWLRQRQGEIDAAGQNPVRTGDGQLFRHAAGKYLMELRGKSDVRTLDMISSHITLLNQWVGDAVLRDMSNDSFACFKADRLMGLGADGSTTVKCAKTGKVRKLRKVSPATVNRALEVARTVFNRAARVWRHNGRPMIATAPLIEMLDESGGRKPYPISWAEQTRLVPALATHLQRPVLFGLATGARADNIVGLRWDWEVPVPELGRSVFLIPAAEFKGKRPHVLILNDVAWSVIEACRGEHTEFVFTYVRPPSKKPHKVQQIRKRRKMGTLNNTAWQTARKVVGLPHLRVHDLRHTFGQRLRDAGVAEEDRALLLGHAIEGMPQHYATATVERLVQAANRVTNNGDRTTLLRVVNG